MNCPSRTDNTDGREGWNQSPNLLAGSTREDFNGMANTRVLRRIESSDPDLVVSTSEVPHPQRPRGKAARAAGAMIQTVTRKSLSTGHVSSAPRGPSGPSRDEDGASYLAALMSKTRKLLVTYSKFIGPGFMIAVAYIDPGNYATDAAAGASYRFQLLFVVLMSNIIAIFLQSLCIKLGSVSGMDLAQMCRAHLPRWLNYFLYFMAESAIIATDIAEVIGTAIALHLLIPQLPLVAGCAISIVDVLLILVFYRPNGSMQGLRAFEFFVMAIVLGVVVCFCIQLSLIQDTSVGEVFRGYLPSSALVEANGLYQACGILGATVMPHSLYLGSGIVQPRLIEFDVKSGHVEVPTDRRPDSSQSSDKPPYQPSLAAIDFCLKFSIFELALSLFTFALFVNSAILIVAGASLSGNADASDGSLFAIYDLLQSTISPIAGTIFALALLLSGVSAGIVCTIAGQMVSEGALNWTIAPWLRRLITRGISILPSIIIAGAVGEKGLIDALNGSQVALSIVLPFTSAPIIYFTCRNKYMSVKTGAAPSRAEHDPDDGFSGGATDRGERGRRMDILAVESGQDGPQDKVHMRNHWVTTVFAVLIWLIITAMNVANLVLLGLGNGA